MPDEVNHQEDGAIEVHLRDYLRIVWKHSGLATAFFVVVVAAVAVVTLRLAPVYKSTATLSIERQWPSSLALQDLISPERPQDEYRKTQQQLIKSRPIVEAAFRKLDLKNHPAFKDARDGVEAFAKSVIIDPREGTYLVDVAIESEDKDNVAKWVNVLVREYVDFMDLEYRSTSRAAEERIEKQIPELRRKLLESEEALQRFLRENNVIAFEKQQDILYKKLDSFETRMSAAQAEAVRLGAALQVLGDAETATPTPTPESLPEAATSDVLKATLKQEASLVEAFARVKAKYRPGHPTYQYMVEQLDAVREKISAEVGKIRGELKAQLEVKKAEMSDLKKLVDELRASVAVLESQSNTYQALRQEVESNRRMYQEFTERRKEIESATSIGKADVRVVEDALPPLDPVRPRKLLNMTLAAVVGLLGGIALAFFIEYLDDTIKAPEETEALGVPLLGVIPYLEKGPESADRDLVAINHSKSAAAEAFRAVRTALTFTAAHGSEPAVFLVTSSNPGEGKTLISTNIAATMAMADRKTLLVDTDLRKPSIHEVFGMDRMPGLTSFFSGECGFDEIVRPGPIANLSVITCGPIPPNPSELLGSRKLGDFIEEAKKRFDLVIFDTPPAVAVTDAMVLASRVDAVIFSLKADGTGKKVAGQCLAEMKRVGGKVAGLVLNYFNARKAGYYRGKYSSYYYYYRYDKYGKSPYGE